MTKTDKRRSIMRAVENLFTSRRFHELTLDEVAQAAAVGKGTIYRYFRDKDDLFFQTVIAGYAELCALLRRTLPGAAPFEQRLADACVQISSFYERRREILRMMQSGESVVHWREGALREQWLRQRRELVASVADIIRQGVAEGKARADIPCETLASVLLGMLRTRAHDKLETARETLSYATIIELFCHGAGAATTTAAGNAAANGSAGRAAPRRRGRRTADKKEAE